jgi:hypothetical protein
MTAIDASAEVDIVWEGKQATVRMPLDGHISEEWARRYRAQAHRRNFSAWAEDGPSRGWVVVELPDGAGRSEVVAALDEARELVKVTDEAEQAADVQDVERAVREWWANQRD